MSGIDLEVTQYVQNILKRPTDRDQQKKVGASNLSDPCTKCLAETMCTGSGHQSEFDMGAVVGTAIHEYLEHRNEDPKALKEFRGLIDAIPGYGDITSTTDLYRIDKKNLVDFKTTTRDKLEKYLSAWNKGEILPIVQRYFRQANLYAYMVEDDIEKVSLCFICRDGQKISRDVKAISMDYDESIAVGAMSRAKRLWAWLEENEYNWQVLNSHPDCYVCSQIRPYTKPPLEEL